MTVILRDEVAAGRVEIVDGHYRLRREAFTADLLAVLEQLAEPD